MLTKNFTLVFLAFLISGCGNEKQQEITPMAEKSEAQNNSSQGKRKMEIMGTGQLPMPKPGDPIPGL